MKKNKKWLAVVLAVVMALSSLSVAFTAFAASTKDEVEKAITEATAYDQKVVDLFNDCEEKSAIDKNLVGKLVELTVKAKAVKYGSTQYINGAETLKAVYAALDLTDDMKAGYDMVFYLSGIIVKDGKSFPTLYSPNNSVAMYTDYVNIAQGGIPAQNTPYESIEIANTLVKDAVDAYNALSEDAKPYVATLSGNTFVSMFAINADTVFGLLKDFVSYLTVVQSTPAAGLYDAVKSGMKVTVDFTNAMDKFANIATKAEAYRTGSMSRADFVAFAEENIKLTDTEILFKNAGIAIYMYNGALVDPAALMNAMTVALELGKYELFIADVKAIDIDTAGTDGFNSKVGALIDSYGALSETYRAQFKADEEMYAKYYQILGLYTGDKTIPNLHESFEKQVYAGNPLVGNTVDSAVAAIKDMLPEVLSALLGTDQDLKTFLESQFTNYNVTYLIATINNLVNDLLGGIELGGMKLSFTIDETIKALGGDYANVVAALDKRGPNKPGTPAKWVCLTHEFIGTEDEVMAHVYEQMNVGDWSCYPMEAEAGTPEQPGDRIYNSWNDILDAINPNSANYNPELFNWGIQEGDFSSFVDALIAGIRPLSGTIAFILPLTNKVATDAEGNVVTTYGPYENLVIPLLETLGAENVMTSAEYTAKYSEASGKKGNSDAMLKPILMQLYEKVLVPLMNNPVDYLINNLPNIAYHLDDGCITGSLLDIISSLGLGLENDPIISKITSFKSIVDLVYGLIANGDATKELTAEQQATSDKIYALITELAKTGTPTVVSTASAKAQNTIKVVADRDNMVNYLVNALPEMFGVELNFAVKGEFVKSEAPAYPHNGKMGKDVMNTMINGLDDLLSGLLNINDLINNGLCTNVMAADAITGIYGALGSIDLSALGLGAQLVPPSVVADAMNEDIYKEVAADLTIDSDNWADVVLVLRNDGKVIDCTDMGFEDGDRDGFINCLAAALRPIMSVAGAALVNGTLSDGSTNYGLYETIILPLFEDIGLTPAATSAEYTDNFNRLVKRTDPNGAYDYLLKTILAPVLDLVDSLAAAPAKTLFTVLPNLAYAIYYNPDIAFLGNLLDSMGGLTGLLNGLLQGIETGKDADGNAVYGLKNFVLPEIPMNALASAGKVTEKESKAALRDTYKVVVADTADAFVTTFYYLYDAINYQDNMKIVSDLIAGIDGLDPSIGTMVGSILNDVFTLSKEEALCALGSLLASDVWACPDGDGNNGDKTPSTGDYSVPAVAVLAVMFAAGAAVMVLRKKKVTE